MNKWASRDLATQAFEACDQLRRATCRNDIETVLLARMAAFGFDYVTCASLPTPGQDPLKGVVLNTRPLEYVRRYLDKGHAFNDPAVTELQNTISSFSWTELKSKRKLNPKELRIVNEAREFGIKDGLTIPIVTTSGSVSIVCPCGARPDVSAAARSAIELIAMIGHQMLVRWDTGAARQGLEVVSKLTAREREVLQWVLVGKTDSEIGAILSVSWKTVNHLIENAKRKLGATRRNLAVAEALRRGEISL